MGLRLVLLAGVVCLASACGVDDANETIGDQPGDVSYGLSWGPLEVGAGVEDTQCIVLNLRNSEKIRVRRVENKLRATSHHFIVYRVNGVAEETTPFPCDPFTDTLDPRNGAPLIITQRKEDVLELPPGVAFTFEPNQMIRLELHFINAGDAPAMAEASAEFVTLAESEFENEADFLFIGNIDVSVPARSAATLGPTYFPLPFELEGINVFGITGHEHQWGTNVLVATTDGRDGTDAPVYDLPDFKWDEPETVTHDPPFQIPSGGGFRFTCDWDNMSDFPVGFGESVNEEMCFFWAYYYPSHGARVCLHTDQTGGENGLDICCPGSLYCSLLGQ